MTNHRTSARSRRAACTGALIGGLLAVTGFAQDTYWVNPADTDPRIDQNLDPHFVGIQRSTTLRNQLFVFFPGTGGRPSDYQEIVRTAARLGFHAVGLSYVNNESVNVICRGATDPGLFVDVRLEIIDGRPRTLEVDVNRANSIEHRLIRLLQALDAGLPGDVWGQFLDEAAIRWDRLLVSGHSQGAGHAGLLAKIHEVQRAVLFAGSDWFGLEARPADWIFAPGRTPVERYFAFAHVRDPIGAPIFLATWEAFGLDVFGPVRFIEATPTWSTAWSHQLFTDVPPRIDPSGEVNSHNAPVVDVSVPRAPDGVTPLFEPVWEYMITGPTQPRRPPTR